ncbi:MAG: response regulator [Elusimicrobia bacterium]|nr:response regulator [Elusimicrobiota bacterium]
MSKDPPTRLLVVDDEADIRAVLEDVLGAAGYRVQTCSNGVEALEAIRQDPPDLCIADLNMPDMDGFELCRRLRQDALFQHLPMIMLTASGSLENKIEGLDLGLDDFVTKPIDVAELLARIRMILRRTQEGLDANPLTRLPGNVSIESRVKQALAANKPLAVLYLDLNQFKAYNDAYGYDAGDKVIKATAQLLIKASKPGEFVGHIGGDDFILVTHPDRMEKLAEEIIGKFDQLVPGFYSEEDRARGKILSTDRLGRVVEFPLLSIAIGVCHNLYKRLNSYAQVSQYGAELKKHAKMKPGSSYVVDRRRQ